MPNFTNKFYLNFKFFKQKVYMLLHMFNCRFIYTLSFRYHNIGTSKGIRYLEVTYHLDNLWNN